MAFSFHSNRHGNKTKHESRWHASVNGNVGSRIVPNATVHTEPCGSGAGESSPDDPVVGATFQLEAE